MRLWDIKSKFLKNGFCIILIFCFGFKCIESHCELKNGTYKIVYDERFSDHPKLKFSIDNQVFKELDNNKEEYKVDWISKTKFRLNSIKKRTDSLTDIEKQLNSLGIPFYEITNCKKDTLYFTYKHNLHITINSGKIIKLK